MSSKRWPTLAAVFVIALVSILFVATRPTAAQPAAQVSTREAQPTSTPPPDTPPIDWASVEMEGDEESTFPHTAAPTGPAPEAPVPPEPSEGTPPPVPPAATTPAPGSVTHVVQAGETLYEIARHYGVPLDQLIAANNVSNPRRLLVGQMLTIPVGGAAGALAPAAATASAGTYVVARGDNLYRIAQRFNVDLAALTAANQITNPRRLEVGQVLAIPEAGAGVVQAAAPVSAAPPLPSGGNGYVVQRGDTLAKIARRFGVALQALISANNLTSPDRILAGWTLSIPGATMSTSETPTAEPVPTQLPVVATTTPPPVSDSLFIWPIPLEDGWIPQWFRSGHPGIDIILPLETPIHAAAGGTVEFSGWNAYGFGNLVVIDHGNGYRTLYAHQNERLVATGDVVEQGDVIGLVGSTGRSTHPHLHFEVREGFTPLNPCDFLPGGCQ